MKKTKNKSRKMRSPKVHIPKHYVWDLMRKTAEDALLVANQSTQIIDAAKRLLGCARNRDVAGYIQLCDDLSLTRLNKEFELTGSHVGDLYWLRLFTFAQKFQFENSPFDVNKAALDTFLKYEAQCKTTNASPIFNGQLDGSWEECSSLDAHVVLPIFTEARDFIARVLGSYPDHNELLRNSRHGPGATSFKAGAYSIPIEKNVLPIDVTPRAKSLITHCIIEDQRWLRSIEDWWKNANVPDFNQKTVSKHLTPSDVIMPLEVLTMYRDFSRIMFVPKSSKTHRTISVEPTGNVYLQLGVDALIRTRLKRWGIDLNTQCKNQVLARQGSNLGDVVTVDLAGASDTIAAKWLEMFPPSWAKLLSMLRCPQGVLKDGEVIVFEKLSAMGNGFTFAVESLIFTALLYGTIKVAGEKWKHCLPSLAVYGDDIVLPTRFFNDYARVLKRAGFTLNHEKTFSNGLVRESCGMDYYDGIDISRPTIKTKPLQTWELIRDYNKFILYSLKIKADLNNTLAYIRRLIPQRSYGPISEELTAWLFSPTPLTPDGVVLPTMLRAEAQAWQTPLYVIKSWKLQPVKLKKAPLSAAKRRCNSYESLMYLSTPHGEKPWWEKEGHTPGRFNFPEVYTTNKLYKDSAGYHTKPVKHESTYYFSKKILLMRPSTTLVYHYEWDYPLR